jgi:hypothetical protein
VVTAPPRSGAGGERVCRSAAQPSRSEWLQDVRSGSGADATASPAATEIRIEHRYPQSLTFVEQHGPQAIVILHDLINHAEERDGQLVVQASVRQIAGRFPFLSKDTVHRRIRELHRAGIIRTAPTPTASRFQRPTYILDLTDTGISITPPEHPST